MANTESAGNPAETQIGDDPKHKMLMAWRTTDERGTHDIQYHHGSMGFGTSAHNFSMHEGEDFIGTMGLDKHGTIQHIEIHPDRRREGLATKLYKFGHEIHEDIPSIPAPKHSETRTAEGDAWAQSHGADKATIPVDKEDYRSNRWKALRNPNIQKFRSHLNEFHAKMMENGLDNKGAGDAKFHVDSAHEYLSRASEVGPEHSSFFDHMNKAHNHIEELGYIHEDHYGNMDDHEKLNDHISRLY